MATLANLCIGNAGAVTTSQTALVSSDYLVLGVGGAAESSSSRKTIVFNNGGLSAPSNANATANGDKLVFYNQSGFKTSIGITSNAGIYFQSLGNTSSGFEWYTNNSGTNDLKMFMNYQGFVNIGNGAVAPTALLHLGASTTARASLCIPSGTAPTSPVSGDFWYDGTNLKFRDGGTTRTITWT